MTGWERVDLDDDWSVWYNGEVSGSIYFERRPVFSYTTGEDSYFFDKEWVSSGIDFSHAEGYYEYLIKNNIDSLEDFLTTWEVDKVSEEFMQVLKAMRSEGNFGDESMIFQSDYGEVELRLGGCGGSVIGLKIFFKNKDSWVGTVYIDEDEEHISIKYFSR